MDWRSLLLPEIKDFISQHEQDDVKSLAFKKPPCENWPYALILDQIKVRQKARIKARELYETNGFLFSSNDIFEQASSQACAAYKASLVSGETFVDFTAGSGSDAFSFAKNFDTGVLIECDNDSASLLENNSKALANAGYMDCKISVYHGLAEEYMEVMESVDFVFIDPQRREKARKGIYELSSGMPDITAMLPILREKAGKVMLKSSPVLDIKKAMETLGSVKEVHVVQLAGECKEVLYLMDFKTQIDIENVRIIAVGLDASGNKINKFEYMISAEKSAEISYGMPRKYIYEPGAAFLKAGGFKSMAKFYNLNKLHKHTHLYTSDNICKNFPGKIYEVKDIIPVKAKFVKIKRADLSLRNFPGCIHDLKKKLKLNDGGDQRIFATTLCNDEKKLVICDKI